MAIMTVIDVSRLKAMLEGIFEVETLEELLQLRPKNYIRTEVVEELNEEARLKTRIETGRKDLLLLAETKFGHSDQLELGVMSVRKPERLSRMIEAILDVDSVEELLAIR